METTKDAPSKFLNGNRITAFVILLVSGNLLNFSLRYGLFLEDGAPGPGLFPAIITAPLVGLCIAWLIIGDREVPKVKQDSDSKDELTAELEAKLDEIQEIDSDGKKRIAWVFFWTIIMFATFERLGSIISLSIYATGLLFSISNTKSWKAIPSTLLMILLVTFGAIKIGVTLPDPFNLFRIFGGQ
jgi:hypothetical protein